MTPLEAVTAADPYPFYSELVAEKPLYFDNSLGLWVASGAQIVNGVLRDARFKVRPGSEPVPNALLGLRSGDVFGSLMRMTDGPKRCPLKNAALDAINVECANECGRLAFDFANRLKNRSANSSSLDVIRRLMFLLPTYTIGASLGVPWEDLDRLTVEVSTLVAGISRLATTEQRILGDCAAEVLTARIETLIMEKPQEGILLRRFFAAGSERSIDDEAVVRNVVGFLFQTYDATAGLLGNSLRVLGRNDSVHRVLQEDDDRLRPFVWEVMRFDPPVQNTRRYASENISLEGSTVHAGDQVLLILAAANRDPSAFPNPGAFELERVGPPSFGFGSGRHECPGQSLALEITCAALRVLLRSFFPANELSGNVVYRASANTRIPLF
jgi:cytochrome P450